MPRRGKSIERKDKCLLGAGERDVAVAVNVYGVSFWDDKNALELNRGEWCPTL